MTKFKLLNWDDVLKFGKHQGKTVRQVHQSDNKYLIWLIKETDLTCFPDEIKKQINPLF